MPYRPLRPKKAQEQEPIESELTAEQVAAYIRQSSTKQVKENIESADMQLSGAQRYAVSQGLDADKIVVAYEGEGKRGVSGTLRIEQRDRLRDTFAGIKAGIVKVVWAYSVSRLFRDKYGVQVATFIEACAEKGVKVVIQNAKVFDFTNSYDIMLFQFLANVAARENEERSKLLHEANAQKAMRGEYHGRTLQVGYIVDRSKASLTYGRYIPYEPHAKVSAWLYRRFRELGGRFNLLATELGKMPVLFPPFESWVDPRDVHQLRLKKVCKLHRKSCDCKQEDCILAGYHVTKTALFRLLTAPEYAGYWRFRGELLTDAEGQPLKNHEAIVPLDDWLYAFNRLSFTTLTGEDNPERGSTRTWTTSKKAEPATLLEGLLVSPLGSVHSSAGLYRVMEKQDDKLHYTNTLVVPTLWIDTLFHIRLDVWLLENTMRSHTFLEEHLKSVKANNAKALASVDEQIKNYRQSIANRDAYIEAVGASLNKESALRLNAAMEEDQGQLTALLAKKNAANKEVTGIMELVERLKRLTGVGESGLEGTEDSRRFIRLACERIELDEYSGHILTLTVRWRAPFSQTDTCYIYRTDAGRQHWSNADKQVLRNLYPEADRLDILKALPKRSWQSMKERASELGIERRTHANTSGSHNSNMSWLDLRLMQAHGHQFSPVLDKQPFMAWWDIGTLESGC